MRGLRWKRREGTLETSLRYSNGMYPFHTLERITWTYCFPVLRTCVQCAGSTVREMFLRHIPSMFLRHIPSMFLQHIPSMFLRHIPSMFLRHIPSMFLRHMPSMFLRHIPSMFLRHVSTRFIRTLVAYNQNMPVSCTENILRTSEKKPLPTGGNLN